MLEPEELCPYLIKHLHKLVQGTGLEETGCEHKKETNTIGLVGRSISGIEWPLNIQKNKAKSNLLQNYTNYTAETTNKNKTVHCKITCFISCHNSKHIKRHYIQVKQNENFIVNNQFSFSIPCHKNKKKTNRATNREKNECNNRGARLKNNVSRRRSESVPTRCLI